MVKRLKEHEPNLRKRSRDSMERGENLGRVLRSRTKSVVVLTDSPEYDPPEYEEDELDLEYNYPERVSEAFENAATKVLGKDHGITLKILTGGAYGEADSGAKTRALFMCYKKKVELGGGIHLGRGGVNCPWGVASMKVPPQPVGVGVKMERLVKEFGYEAEDDLAWRVISVSDGG
eukprot:g2836.t1